MKTLHFKHILAVILTATAMSFMFTSCNSKLNPEVKDLPGADFTVSAIETRGTDVEFPWTISPNGKTDSVNEQIDEMYVTQYNKVTLTVKGNGAGFTGVNIESSNPKAVQVHELSANNYVLIYVADGSADISIWNGSGQAIKRTTFHVTAQEYIDVTGLRFTYGGEPLVVKHVVNSRPKVYCKEEDEYPQFSQRSRETDFTWWQYKKPNVWVDDPDKPGYGTFVIDTTDGALMRFEGFEPENTSFRTVNAFESEWDFCFNMTNVLNNIGYFESGMYANWPNERSVNKDISEYARREIWIAQLGAPMYIACVKVDTKNGAKYLLLYYGDNEYNQ